MAFDIGMTKDCMMCYREPHRFYHVEDHILEMFSNIANYKLSDVDIDILKLAIVYHDCVYDPKRKDNEKLSCDRFRIDFPDFDYSEKVVELIMATKTHIYGEDALVNAMIDLDMAVFAREHMGLIKYEHEIFKEYQFVPIETYIIERVKFLKTVPEKIKHAKWYVPRIKKNIDFLINYVKGREYKIGIFAGSFDPYHKGHENIKLKAEKLFDKIIIARGINPDKPPSTFEFPELYNEIVKYNGLVTELFKTSYNNVSLFFVRGLRNVYDLSYEENLRKIVHDVDSSIKFSYFFCDRRFEHISSSQIRGLLKFDKNVVKKYLL